MPSRKRRTTTTKKATAGVDMPVAAAEEESRPIVTQVVEVVEEGELEPTSSMPQESAKEEVTQGSSPAEEEKTELAEDRGEPEKRKEMVDELYADDRGPVLAPEISMHKNSSKKSVVVWAMVTIMVALLTGVILFSVSGKGSVASVFARPTPTPTPAPTATPTPTPAQVDKSSFEIRVLNGGGTPGAAGKMRKFLENKGYTVSGTGNTDEYTYDTTEIHGKPTMTDAVANLKADLKDDYTLGIVATDLDASASADVQVIVGKE